MKKVIRNGIFEYRAALYGGSVFITEKNTLDGSFNCVEIPIRHFKEIVRWFEEVKAR
jgi:hypothetical protein